jgi:AAA+ ATPase superfamily predicted ATPase
MISPNPFTPQSGWEPKIFCGRENEINSFNAKLEGTIESGRPSHLVVLGEWGIGKTSLLKQFKRISQEKGFCAAYCAISRFTEKNSPIDAVYLAAEEMIMGFPKLDANGDDLLKVFSKKKGLMNAQVQFAKFLLEVWKALDTKLAIVLLDDIQNLMPIATTIDVLRAVLSTEEVIKNTRFLFVLSSTPRGWQSFIDKHDPVGRFFRKRIYVENLDKQEVAQSIGLTLENTGVVFDKEVKEIIFAYTNGHPYEVQLLSSHLYDGQIEGIVKKDAWENALNNTLKELGRDYFSYLFAKASDREQHLLKIMAEERKPLSIKEFTTMMIVGKHAKKFPIANIKNFLYRLEEKDIVKRNDNGAFYIPDLMFREYVLRI